MGTRKSNREHDKIQELTQKELKEFQSNARISIMAAPILMSVATFFAWLFDFYWIVALIWTIIISIIFFVVYMKHGKEPIDNDIKEGVKFMRMGVIKEAELEQITGRHTKLKTITITLEEEPIPESYPETHSFVIYNNSIQLYHKRDSSLPGRYKELKGETVVIEYFPKSGSVISFTE